MNWLDFYSLTGMSLLNGADPAYGFRRSLYDQISETYTFPTVGWWQWLAGEEWAEAVALAR